MSASIALAGRLAEVADLQERADRSAHTRETGGRTVWAARQAGLEPPAPARAAWPAQLAEALMAEEAHRNAPPERSWEESMAEAQQNTSTPPDLRARQGAVQLTPPEQLATCATRSSG
ncbi:hypothetical protein [Streptomyces sp. cg36]|uniref:hypothetical protein n=1 Tax=Streptomyces sp. cg36 TaxID=3238798 RepID=UPI0034E1CD54